MQYRFRNKQVVDNLNSCLSGYGSKEAFLAKSKICKKAIDVRHTCEDKVVLQ